MSNRVVKERLSRLLRPPASSSGSAPTPLALLATLLVAETVARTAEDPNSSLSIGGPVSLKIPGEIVRDNRDSLLSDLGMVRSRTCDNTSTRGLKWLRVQR